MAYLDDTGLAYFWGKIKAWANSVFALISHTHPSSDVTLMTGYSKPSSGSAIGTGDTLNQAVGKLEAKVDVAIDDSNYVHRTGDETIAGQKEFTGPSLGGDGTITQLLLRNMQASRGTAPSASLYNALLFCDASGVDWNASGTHGRMMTLQAVYLPDGTVRGDLGVYKNQAGSTDSAAINVGIDASGTSYARAPSTSSLRSTGTDIVTRDWIPNDDRIVHRTNVDEHILGYKSFSQTVTLKYGTLTKGTVPSDDRYKEVRITDNAGEYIGSFATAVYTSRLVRAYIAAYKYEAGSSASARLSVIYPASGDPYATAPTPPSLTASDTKIATTEWVRGATGNFACNAATATALKTSRTIRTNLASTATASFDGSANVTPGVTGTLSVANGGTGLTSLDTFVRTTGDQTVGGTKTFNASVIIRRVNPYLDFEETDIKFGTGLDSGGTAFQGLRFVDKDSTVVGELVSQIIDSGKGSRITLRPRYYASSSSQPEAIVACVYNGSGVKQFTPITNGDILLGTSSTRWKEVWCTQSSINSSSDERIKTSIDSIPDEVLDAWESVEWLQYKFIEAAQEKGERARYHTGTIAQQVDRAFRARGLDVSAYGLFLHDSWDAMPEELDSNGNVSIPARPAGDEYGLRYVEALCMEAAYQRRENARLKKRVSDLEDRLAALELRLGSE